MTEIDLNPTPDTKAEAAGQKNESDTRSRELAMQKESQRLETSCAARAIARRVWSDKSKDNGDGQKIESKNKAEITIGLLGNILSTKAVDNIDERGRDPIVCFEGKPGKEQVFGTTDPHMRYIRQLGRMIVSIDKRISTTDVSPTAIQKGEMSIVAFYGKTKGDNLYHFSVQDSDGNDSFDTLTEEEFTEVFMASQGQFVTDGLKPENTVGEYAIASSTLSAPESRSFWTNLAGSAEEYFSACHPSRTVYPAESICTMAGARTPKEAQKAIEGSVVTRSSAIQFCAHMMQFVENKLSAATAASNPVDIDKFTRKKAELATLVDRITNNPYPDASDLLEVIRIVGEDEIRSRKDAITVELSALEGQLRVEKDIDTLQQLKMKKEAKEKESAQFALLLNTVGGSGSIFQSMLGTVQDGASLSNESVFKLNQMFQSADNSAPLLATLEEFMIAERKSAINTMPKDERSKLFKFINEHQGEIFMLLLMMTTDILKSYAGAATKSA